MLNITNDNFDELVLSADKPVFVDFYADWCGPCKMMAPIVDELEGEYDGKLIFGKCNIDDNMQIAQKYRIMSIPTFIIFKNGEPKEAIIGGCSKSELQAKINSQI